VIPGGLLHRIVRRLFSASACESVFEPLIADLQKEWLDAPSTRRVVVLAGGYAGFCRAVVACGIAATWRGLVSPIAWEMASPTTRAFLVGSLGVMMLRFAGGTRGSLWYWQHYGPRSFVLGELATLGWSIVFAMAPAFMYARRQPDRAWDATTSRLLAAGLLLTIVTIGWVGPILFAAEQHSHGRFIEGVQPAFQSLPTVIQELRRATTADDLAMWQTTLYRRLAQVANALVLALIGWQLGGLKRPTLLRAAFWWFTLMELVLVSGSYAINREGWLQWRATILLAGILLTLGVLGRFESHDLNRRASMP
jgi:hypothetical protein